MEPPTPGPSPGGKPHATIGRMHRHRLGAAETRRSRRLGALAIGLALLLAACGTTGPTGTPASAAQASPSAASSPSAGPTTVVDPETLYSTIENQVVAIRGLKPKAQVHPQVLDDAGLKNLV